MTLRKSLCRHLSFPLFMSVAAACGSDTPAFQEKAMSALMNQPQSAPAESADAVTASVDEDSERSAESLNPYEASEINSNLKVDVKDSQLRFGSQTTLASSLDGDPTSDVTYTVLAPAGKDPGQIINGNTYVPPATGTQGYEVTIIAVSTSDPTQTSSTVVKLEPSTQVFAGCTNDQKGFPIKADVYALPEDTVRLPNFTLYSEKTTTACMEAFQVRNRAWSDGFPGQPNLIEWFAIRASGQLTISTAGKYSFKLNADDGAKLYIDGQLVVDNDGIHAEKAVVGSKTLSAGQHEIVMEYFQGPRYHIALELFWKAPGSSSYVYVPASAFKPQ